MSIDSPSEEEAGFPPVFLTGDFSGEEKSPSMDSKPFSSRAVGLRVIPVLLDRILARTTSPSCIHCWSKICLYSPHTFPFLQCEPSIWQVLWRAGVFSEGPYRGARTIAPKL